LLRALLHGAESLPDLEHVELNYSTKGPIDVNNRVQVRSLNFPGRYLRHQNSLGELTELQTDLDRQDATFRVVPGLAQPPETTPHQEPPPRGVSLESVNFPGHYLRHQDFRLKLHPFSDDPLFKEDATFDMVDGLADSTGVSFRSHNFPDRYLRHRDSHAWVEGGSDALFKQDATFFMRTLNARLVLGEGHQRADALARLLEDYLALMEAGTYEEEQPLVGNTLLMDTVASRIVELSDAPDVPSQPDKTAPTIKGLAPKPKGRTKERMPLIAASVRDDRGPLVKANLSLRVDGKPIRFAYDPESGRMTFRPKHPIRFGRHTVRLTARDGAGNSKCVAWDFEVVR
jgi:hypothetical protein